MLEEPRAKQNKQWITGVKGAYLWQIRKIKEPAENALQRRQARWKMIDETHGVEFGMTYIAINAILCVHV